jgi:hypothetical protein
VRGSIRLAFISSDDDKNANSASSSFAGRASALGLSGRARAGDLCETSTIARAPNSGDGSFSLGDCDKSPSGHGRGFNNFISAPTDDDDDRAPL